MAGVAKGSPENLAECPIGPLSWEMDLSCLEVGFAETWRFSLAYLYDAERETRFTPYVETD
jgi:hypothetical protein